MYDDFIEWMQFRGRSVDTAKLYALNVRMALGHPKGYRGRLMDKKLAPKTKRIVLASLRAYAMFKNDEQMTKVLRDVKLPPAIRVEAKTPLTQEHWINLIREIHNAAYLSVPMRAVLGMLVLRGFRVGDVCRLTRQEVLRAIDTGTLSFEAKGNRRLEYRAKPFMTYLRSLAQFERWGRVYELLTTSEERGQKQAVDNVEYTLKTVAARADLPPGVHPHKLRRTYAVYFLQQMQGDPEGLLKLKAQMQWADLNTASQYVDHSRSTELAQIEDALFKGLAKKTT